MLSSDSTMPGVMSVLNRYCLLAALLLLGACQFQPLHGDYSAQATSNADLSTVSVSQVNSRVAQQVRNHLIFLLKGGTSVAENTHEYNWDARGVGLFDLAEAVRDGRPPRRGRRVGSE